MLLIKPGWGPNMEADGPLLPLPRTIKTQLAGRRPAKQGTILLCRNARGWAKGQWGSNEAVRTEPEKVVPGREKTWVRTGEGLPSGEHVAGDTVLACVHPGCATDLHPPTGLPCELGA